jgi:hypothetical protein
MKMAFPITKIDFADLPGRWWRIFRRWFAWPLAYGLSIFLLIAAGYLLTYHLFFINLPLRDISSSGSSRMTETFIFEGVSYFDGTVLEPGQQDSISYVVPRVVSLAGDMWLEFFVRLGREEEAESYGSGQVGSLVVTQGKGKALRVPLSGSVQQRMRIPWSPSFAEKNTLSVKYEAVGHVSPPRLVFATNIKGVNLFFPALILGLVGFALAVIVKRRQGQRHVRALLAVTLPVVLMYFMHSGAFISNEYISAGEGTAAHGKLGSACIQAKNLGKTGSLGKTCYRNVGFAIVPLASALVEGGAHALYQDFADIYPTTRYVMFVWTAVAMAFLAAALSLRIRFAVGLVFGLLYAIHFPFFSDLYDPDADAYLIPLFTMALAFFVHYIYEPGKKKYLAYLGLTLLAMFTVKSQPIFVVVMMPFVVWIKGVVQHKRWVDRRAVLLFLVITFSLVSGKCIVSYFHHPDRNVGIEGVKFGRHVFWNQPFAANGQFDRWNPFGFVKSRNLRIRLVAEKTGLPVLERADHSAKGYLHHSQIAVDEVYKPAVLKALRERPGFFYSNAWYRYYEKGIRFLHYVGKSVQNDWYVWQQRGGKWKTVSGKRIREVPYELELNRRGKMWKIAPAVFMTKLVQYNVGSIFEICAIIVALAGVFLIPNTELKLFLFLCFAAQTFAVAFIHWPNRYVSFLNVALIIGLSVFMVVSWTALRRSANHLFNDSSVPVPK